jgi:hypothetical protein
MADQPTNIPLLPNTPTQNPAPFAEPSQRQKDAIQIQTTKVLDIFRQILPSNYVSQVTGPYYTLQFQAIAEAIATFQITAQECFEDAMYDYTRSEVLFQILGMLVFPNASVDGWPTVHGDISYRDFLRRMVTLLLQGSTKKTVKEGVELLTDATVEIVEKGIAARQLRGLSAWGPDDQFTFEINVTNTRQITVDDVVITLPTFPDDIFTFIRNVQIVMRALKPAHTLYDLRFVFWDAFTTLTDVDINGNPQCEIDFSNYYYDEFRHFCLGIKEINGTAGRTLVDKTLFSDPTRDFSSVSIGATLTLLSGPNMAGGGGFTSTPSFTPESYPGRYRVENILYFPVDTDATPVSYVTSPTGLTGSLTIDGDTITDASQDFSYCVEGEILTITNGNNAGNYRLKTLCGNNGGPVGSAATGSGITQVKIAPSILRVQFRMPEVAVGQTYSVSVDRLGCQTPKLEMEDVTSQFGITPNNLITVLYGPLVKSWGDATPATEQDVQVYVNSVLVDVSAVNPYIGEITLQIPVISPTNVRVEYYWMRSPTMVLAGLNTEGLALNKWSFPSGRHTTSTSSTLGAMDTTRFPFRVVLGPISRLEPLMIGWRYLGFENEYSALLNDSNLLRLNQNPKQSQIPILERDTSGDVSVYECETTPIADGWTLIGVDSGAVNADFGTYTLIDNQSGEYDPTDPKLATYFKEIDLTFPAAVNFVTRFYITSTTLDGIYTGVGFGINDPEYLFFVGLLKANDVQHIGLLLNPAQPQLISSWLLGPQVAGEIQELRVLDVVQYAVKFTTADLPSGLSKGNRFQIFTGTQAGVYTIQNIFANCDGTSSIVIDGTFPADYKLYGNRDVTAVFEIVWSHWPITYRVNLDPVNQIFSLQVAGLISGQIIATDKTETTFPFLSDSLLSVIMPPKEGYGHIWWGSTSSWAKNTSVWSFIRYGITTDQTKLNQRIVDVQTNPIGTEPYVLPENNSLNPWFLDQDFGFSLINPSTANTTYVTKGVASDSLPLTYGYTRVEPFFKADTTIDLQTRFKTLFGSSGTNGCISLKDTQKEVLFGCLTLYEQAVTGVRRKIISCPSVNMVGYLDPVIEQGWASSVGGGTYYTHEEDVWIKQATDEALSISKTLDTTVLPAGYKTGGVIEARLAISTYTLDSGGTSPYFGACFSAQTPSIPVTKYKVFVRFGIAGSTPTVYLCDSSFTPVGSGYAFDWTDGNLHSYRINGSLTGVTITIDDVVQLPALSIVPFNVSDTEDNTAVFGVDATGTSTTQWRSFSYVEYADDDGTKINRTLGIWKGGDRLNINNWEIPRKDSTTDSNSNVPLASIQLMDWRDFMDIQLVRNSTWGVTLYRPAPYPNPPYYNHAIPISRGWINVEYPRLPDYADVFGTVAFGAVEPTSLCWQEWDAVSYQIYKILSVDYIQPQHMVLNYYNVINSGELSEDVTWETMGVQTINNTSVSLLPTHIFAKYIWKIIDGTTIYTSSDWTFNQAIQLVTLGKNELNQQKTFQNSVVTVVYIPGKPVTNTYLQTQPLLDGITKLNEGTPPVPANDSKYTGLEFITVTDGGQTGLITPICETGLGYGLSGAAYWEQNNSPNDGTFGSPTQYLYASGGSYIGPVVDVDGNITAHNNPLGGLLNQVILYPIGLPQVQQDIQLSYAEIVPEPTDTLIDCLTVISIDPDSGAAGSTISADIIGAGFVLGADARLRKSGQSDIVGSSVSVVSPTEIICSFNLTGAVSGNWDVVVTNSDGASAALIDGFTVTGGSFSIISITPNESENYSIINITDLAGTGFQTGANVKLRKTLAPDIDGTDVVVVSPTQITCNFDISAGVEGGAYDVVVINPDLEEATLPSSFTIAPLDPVVLSVTPDNGRGVVNITNLAGRYFRTGNPSWPTVQFTNGLIVPASSVVAVSDTQITCTIDTTTLYNGLTDIEVFNDGTHVGVLHTCFNVTNLRFGSINPGSGVRGTTVSVTITGENFLNGITAKLFRSGKPDINAINIVFINPTQMTCDFVIPAGAFIGFRYIQVSNPDGQTSNSSSPDFTIL